MPMPVTTPAAGACPSYWSYATIRPTSMKRESASQSCSIRSRAESFPCEWSFWIFSGPPPRLSFASSSRTSALSSRRRDVTSGPRLRGVLALAGSEPILDVVHELRCRCAGTEKLSNSLRLKCVHVLSGDDSAPGDQDVVATCVLNELSNTRNERHVRPTQYGQADNVRVFLNSSRGDHFGRLMQTGINDFHSGVTECGCDYLRPAIVPIQAGFGDKNSNWSHTGVKVSRVRDGRATQDSRVTIFSRQASFRLICESADGH